MELSYSQLIDHRRARKIEVREVSEQVEGVDNNSHLYLCLKSLNINASNFSID